MVSDSPRPNLFTPERIAELQQRLRDHPLDPNYDTNIVILDDCTPYEAEQERAFCIYTILEDLGELPPECKINR